MTTQAHSESHERDLAGDVAPEEGAIAGVEAAALLALHRSMALAQAVDERLAAEVRRGALESWRPGGSEAVLVGAASVLGARDWLFAGSRDLSAAIARGVPLDQALAHVFATAGDPNKGRVPAPRLASRTPALGSYGFHNGAHLTHAAGVAWAAKIRKEDAVALALFDQSELASGEFHNALNFAGVFKLPVVFVAVRASETPGARAAGRGVAYGVPGIVCDGHDVLAVTHAVAEAVARARRGEGSTLVDAVVAEEGESPVARFEARLVARGLQPSVQNARDAIAREVDEAVKAAAARVGSPLPIETMFDDVYGVVPSHLAEQRDSLGRTRNQG